MKYIYFNIPIFCLFVVSLKFASGLSEKIEISVNKNNNPNHADDNILDLSDIKILNEGEDATGSMDPRDLMVRAFGKLPYDEQVRIGFADLVEQEKRTGVAIDIEALTKIWDQRQEALKVAMEEITETAKILTTFIKNLETATSDDENINGDEALDILYQLEDYLSDIDNARDFHDALGGWSVLSHLLSLKKIRHPEDSAQAATLSEVRGMAAMVIGTAIKNEPAFNEWVLESVDMNKSGLMSNSEQHIPIFPEVPAADTIVGSFVSLINSPEMPQKVRKNVIYALGSSIRYNAQAQEIFVTTGGVKALSNTLRVNFQECASQKADWTYRTKVLNLVIDLLEETAVATNNEGTKNSPLQIINKEIRSVEWQRLVRSACFETPPAGSIPAGLAKLHEAGIRFINYLLNEEKFDISTVDPTLKSTLLDFRQYYKSTDNEYYFEIGTLFDKTLQVLGGDS